MLSPPLPAQLSVYLYPFYVPPPSRMTGLAQVRGFRGATEEEIDLTNHLQADLEYVSGWSTWRDIGIVATFRMLTRRNAF